MIPNCKRIDEELIKLLLDKFYPIGCIYESVDETNPGELFGGTWVIWGEGKTSVCVDKNDTDFNTVEKTGGNKSIKLTVANLPSHNHTFTGSKHTHTVPAHAHGLNSHTHSFSTTTGSTTPEAKMDFREAGNSGDQWEIVGNYKSVNKNVTISKGPVKDGSKWSLGAGASQSQLYSDTVTISMPHTHSVSGTTGGNTGNTANSSVLTSGETTQSGTIGNTGSGTNINVIQPYITSYKFKRIN